MLVLLLLAGCKPHADQPAVPAQAVKARAKPTPTARPALAQGQVRVRGDDALAGVLSWSLPEVAITHPGKARAAARHALASGDLFETANSALPLLLALQRMQPGNAGDAALLEKARDALLAQAWAALAAGNDLASLRYAQRQGTVLHRLWPELPQVQDFLAAVDRVGQAFGKALAVWPTLLRAQHGLGTLDDVLVAQAQMHAASGDFDGAYAVLAQARQVRASPWLAATVGARIEAARTERLRRMRDAGLIALGTGNGLQFAREQFVDMLRIAKPGDAASSELRQRIDLVSHYGAFRPGQVFTDAMPDASRGPSLVVVPFGGFMMGASANEVGANIDEQPQHRVDFARGFAMSRYEITVGQFRRFVQATGYVPRATQRGHSMAYDVRSGTYLGYDGLRHACP